MATRPAEPEFDLGALIASYGWSFSSRSTVVFVGLLGVIPGVGWAIWEIHDYGNLSIGGAILSGFAIGAGLLAIVVGISARSNPALELFEHGLVSHLHRTDSVVRYCEMVSIVKAPTKRFPDLHVIVLKDGKAIRLHAIRHLKDVLRQISARSGIPVDVPPGWARAFKR